MLRGRQEQPEASPYDRPRPCRSGAIAQNLFRNRVAMAFRIADPATGLRMKSMTQRASKPHRVLGGGYPSEGVKALWAFHKQILAWFCLLVRFFLRVLVCFNPMGHPFILIK